MRKILSVLTLAMFTVRCASIAHGTHQTIPISSNPPGATVAVSCGKAKPVLNKTPTTFDAPRHANPCSIIVSKEGYEDSSFAFTRRMSGWFWGNILIGGILGMIIDGADGAIYNVVPEVANITLQRRLAGESAAAEPSRPTLEPGEEIVSADLVPPERRLKPLPGYQILTVRQIGSDGTVSVIQRYYRPQ